MQVPYEMETRVVIKNLSPRLDGMIGTVVGISYDELFKIYIVLLDQPLLEYDNQRAICVQDSCLSIKMF
jgi:hypothetical protein